MPFTQRNDSEEDLYRPKIRHPGGWLRIKPLKKSGQRRPYLACLFCSFLRRTFRAADVFGKTETHFSFSLVICFLFLGNLVTKVVRLFCSQLTKNFRSSQIFAGHLVNFLRYFHLSRSLTYAEYLWYFHPQKRNKRKTSINMLIVHPGWHSIQAPEKKF